MTGLAGTTLFVYLVHEVVVFGLHRLTDNQPVAVAVSLILSFALGTLAKTLFDRLDTWVQARWTGQRPLFRLQKLADTMWKW